MGKEIQGQLEGKGRKFAIVVSRFNELFSGKLLDGAKDCLARHGVDSGGVDIYWVPGSFEIAPVAKRVAAMKYDAVICLGAVIRGDTPHFNYIAAEVSKGIAHVYKNEKSLKNTETTSDKTSKSIINLKNAITAMLASLVITKITKFIG